MYWHNPCEINGNSPGVVAKTWPGEAWNGMETPFFMEVLRDDWAIPEVSLVAFSQRQCTWQIYANIKDAGRPACSMVRATSIQIVWKGCASNQGFWMPCKNGRNIRHLKGQSCDLGVIQNGLWYLWWHRDRTWKWKEVNWSWYILITSPIPHL